MLPFPPSVRQTTTEDAGGARCGQGDQTQPSRGCEDSTKGSGGSRRRSCSNSTRRRRWDLTSVAQRQPESSKPTRHSSLPGPVFQVPPLRWHTPVSHVPAQERPCAFIDLKRSTSLILLLLLLLLLLPPRKPKHTSTSCGRSSWYADCTRPLPPSLPPSLPSLSPLTVSPPPSQALPPPLPLLPFHILPKGKLNAPALARRETKPCRQTARLPV